MRERARQGPQTLLLQLGVAIGQSESCTHCTHAVWPCCVSQTGFVASLQSLFITQIAHSPRSVLHTGAATGQSELCRHATHWLSVVLQNGVVPPQFALLVHPSRQVKSWGLQIGRAVPQSLFERHSTQLWSPRKQRGAAAPQSELARQPTQRSVVVSQSGRFVPAQSVLALQPMQSPVAVSQMSSPPPPQLALPVHAA